MVSSTSNPLLPELKAGDWNMLQDQRRKLERSFQTPGNNWGHNTNCWKKPLDRRPPLQRCPWYDDFPPYVHKHNNQQSWAQNASCQHTITGKEITHCQRVQHQSVDQPHRGPTLPLVCSRKGMGIPEGLYTAHLRIKSPGEWIGDGTMAPPVGELTSFTSWLVTQRCWVLTWDGKEELM